jgi:hypothetical protein
VLKVLSDVVERCAEISERLLARCVDGQAARYEMFDLRVDERVELGVGVGPSARV